MENKDFDRQNIPPSPKKVDIASLYPTAKTYDESMLERSVIKQKRATKIEKETQFEPLYLAVGSSLAILMSVYVINYIPHLFENDPLGGPRTGLILMMAVVALNMFIVWQIAKYADLKGKRSVVFFVAYIVSFAPELYAWRVFEPIGKLDAQSMTAVTVANFIIVLLLSLVTFSKRFSSSVRFAVVALITLVCIVAAIIIGSSQSQLASSSITTDDAADVQFFPSD
jgi:FtsH-binding integral membrane protein